MSRGRAIGAGAGVCLAVLAAAVALVANAHRATAGAPPPPGARLIVDDFESVSAWSAHPADGVTLAIHSDPGLHGRAMRLDFGFTGGGYAVARRAVSLDLPANYRFRFTVRGECQPNDLEFKLIDASGENVWWCNRRRYRFTPAWDSLSTRKRQIEFAWGPIGGGDIRHVASIEFAITAGSGGLGSVWIDDLALEALPTPNAEPPVPLASASSSGRGVAPGLAVDGDTRSAWASAPRDAHPWLQLDLVEEREFGGLVIDWADGHFAPDYDIEISADGAQWRTIRAVRGGNGGRDWLRLPETESRFVRVRVPGTWAAAGIGVREIELRPLEWGATLESFFRVIARDSPRGSFPRGLAGEQSYWTVIGTDAGEEDEALLGEDGVLETGKARYSIEPFVRANDSLITWADVRAEQALANGNLPIPTVTWRRGDLELGVTAFATDAAPGGPAAMRALAANGPGVVARYRVRNHGGEPMRATLYLALRPFQVNPPEQFLNTPGGVAPIRTIARDGAVIRVNGVSGIVSLTPPAEFGAATFDQGDIVEFLRSGRVPPNSDVSDPFEHASGALAYPLDLPAGAEREVDVFVPLAGRPRAPTLPASPALAEAAEQATRTRWAMHERGISIQVPPCGADVMRTVRAQLGWILINRDGPAIQPGSRSYDRSWIRDGSLTCAALLRLGHPEIVRPFIEWFSGYLYPNGKAPCCVDLRGADPVPEHDSSGEFIFLVAEYYRYTGDREMVARQWPAVTRAAAYLDSLRQTRRSAEWRAPDTREFFGLLPPSISHEGYSAKPMHSYWDDFWALRGFKDAAYLAGALGRDRERTKLAAIRDEFQRDIAASIGAAMARYAIDYIPGCADLGDFDATSTTIALAPVGAETMLPRPALLATFEKYWEFFRSRRDGPQTWDAYTPYETRVIGSMVRLGWRERADSLTTFFMRDRRPAGWAEWAEVVDRDPRHARFIGDMPHTWVGSDFVRSVLDGFAYDRESDSSLVVGAGIPLAWVTEAPGVTVRGLPTPYGPLGFEMHASGDSVSVAIDAGVRVPRGGIVVRPPSQHPVRDATVNGVRAPVGRDGEVVVRHVPARVAMWSGPAGR